MQTFGPEPSTGIKLENDSGFCILESTIAEYKEQTQKFMSRFISGPWQLGHLFLWDSTIIRHCRGSL